MLHDARQRRCTIELVKLDPARIKASRIPLTGMLVMVVAATAMFVVPRGPVSTNPVDVAVEPGDQAAAGESTAPTTVASATVAPDTTTTSAPAVLAVPAPVGGVRPEWPEWITPSNVDTTEKSYTATLTASKGGLKEVLVWLSMQGWIATGDAVDAPTWELRSGAGHTGTLARTTDNTFVFTTTRA